MVFFRRGARRNERGLKRPGDYFELTGKALKYANKISA
jgi:hypothetical protein